MKRPITNMAVVITGASAGIGAALARDLHGRGARLLLAARRADRLQQMQRELGAGQGKFQAEVLTADVGRPEDCARLIDFAFARLGRIDTLVCNAGYGEMRPVTEMTPERVTEMFAVNLIGTTECIRLAVPRMREQSPLARGLRPGRWSGERGQVMIVSSAAARRGLPFFGVYSATKAAQLSVAEALRVELMGTGIAVTSVHPVGTTTEFFDVAERRGERKMAARVVGDVTQTPEHVAGRMVRAMERPVPEVWPFWPVRWALAFSALFPSAADRIMAKARAKM